MAFVIPSSPTRRNYKIQLATPEDDASANESLHSDDHIFHSSSSDTSIVDDSLSQLGRRYLVTANCSANSSHTSLDVKSTFVSTPSFPRSAGISNKTKTEDAYTDSTATQHSSSKAKSTSAAPNNSASIMSTSTMSTSTAQKALPLIVSSACETMSNLTSSAATGEVASTENQIKTPANQRTQLYDVRKKHHPDPTSVPASGSLFLHDTRQFSYGSHGSNNCRPYGGRGKSHYGNNGGYGYNNRMSYSSNDPTTSQWTHDKHFETLGMGYGPNQSQSHRRGPHNMSHGNAYNRPSSNLVRQPNSNKPIDRSLSSERHTGNAAMRVSIPGVLEPRVYQGFQVKQYTKLPDHRPPLRRDKPVQIRIPGDRVRLVLPAIDRSFEFIPRALRPNQQKNKGGRQRMHLSFGDGYSRAPSAYGDASSIYSASAAHSHGASRRSSIVENLFSPIGSAVSRAALPMMDGAKPTVKLPPVVHKPMYPQSQNQSRQGLFPPTPSSMPHYPLATSSVQEVPPIVESTIHASAVPLSESSHPPTPQPEPEPEPVKQTSTGAVIVVSSTCRTAQPSMQESTPSTSANLGVSQNQAPALARPTSKEHSSAAGSFPRISERAIHAPVFHPSNMGVGQPPIPQEQTPYMMQQTPFIQHQAPYMVQQQVPYMAQYGSRQGFAPMMQSGQIQYVGQYSPVGPRYMPSGPPMGYGIPPQVGPPTMAQSDPRMGMMPPMDIPAQGPHGVYTSYEVNGVTHYNYSQEGTPPGAGPQDMGIMPMVPGYIPDAGPFYGGCGPQVPVYMAPGPVFHSA